MNKNLKLLFIKLFTVILLVSVIYVVVKEIVFKPDFRELVILHTNDVHGRLEPISFFDISDTIPPLLGGYNSKAVMIKKLRDEYTDTKVLLLDAGDFYSGTPEARITDGKVCMEFMNYIKYNALTVGNHEFDYGFKTLKQLLNQAEFPVLGSNIIFKKDILPPLKNYIILKKNDIKIGIFGLTTKDTLKITGDFEEKKYLKFADEFETAKRVVNELKSKVDLIIALTHIGVDKDTELAKNVKGIDIIIGGHSHTGIKKPLLVKNTIIEQTFAYGPTLGFLKIKYDINNNKICRYEGKLIPLYVDYYGNDRKVLDMINPVIKKVNKTMGDKIVTLKQSLLRKNIPGSMSSTIGNLITSAIAEAGEVKISFQNKGGIRTNLPPRPLIEKNLYYVLPFRNKIVTMYLTGDQITEIIDASVTTGITPLEVYGLNVFISQVSEKKFQVDKILYNGNPLVNNKKYKIATNGFLAGGGDNYPTFKKGLMKKTYNITILDAVKRKLQKNKVYYADKTKWIVLKGIMDYIQETSTNY